MSLSSLEAKSAFEVAAEFIVPPSFKNVTGSRQQPIALQKERLMLEWADPHGNQLTLRIDDSNSTTRTDVTSRMAQVVEQTKAMVPAEAFESTYLAKVKGHDWIVLRLRGGEPERKYLRILAVGELGGMLVEVGLGAFEDNATDLDRYLNWILEDNSSDGGAGPAALTAKPHGENETVLNPDDAIRLAAAAAPKGVDGVFQFQVRATGRDKNGTYLNSEPDYKDPRCLTIHFPPRVAEEYTKRTGHDPDALLKGKTIRVSGAAKKVPITLFAGGIPTGQYDQTHVMILDPRQIEVIAEP